MLSVCIPIYNHYVDALVLELHQQASHLSSSIQIILIDDGSKEEFRVRNNQLASLVSYIQLPDNIGRSAIRNRFLEYAQYDHLLFLDCDGLLLEKKFISNYLEAIKLHPNAVVCGGRVYPDTPPNRSERLRWKYGVFSESKDVSARKLNPYASFMTNNFVVRKDTLAQIKFNESLSGYGHEDTLFGFELKQAGIEIHHIDNPVLNDHLEDNKTFINQTETGIRNLIYILENISNPKELGANIRLVTKYNQLSIYHGLIGFSYTIFRPIIRFMLGLGITNLTMFNFYKLGYFIKQKKQ